ncbi:AraC family transcriptional regulator [Coprobacillaceae bacterium CR2/5/TPMF4]|nr:AraC family transcriptional regulator [Coprobacillaceae bacterium CR2/5/TPMF4]
MSLNELAALTNYNKSYLSTVFKKKMGISIFEYIKMFVFSIV